MRVISKKPLRESWELHPESRPMLEDWVRKASQTEHRHSPRFGKPSEQPTTWMASRFSRLGETATAFAQSYTKAALCQGRYDAYRIRPKRVEKKINAVIDVHELIPAWQALQSAAPLAHIENEADYEQALLNSLAQGGAR